jgi:hypothetical protein
MAKLNLAVYESKEAALDHKGEKEQVYKATQGDKTVYVISTNAGKARDHAGAYWGIEVSLADNPAKVTRRAVVEGLKDLQADELAQVQAILANLRAARQTAPEAAPTAPPAPEPTPAPNAVDAILDTLKGKKRHGK